MSQATDQYINQNKDRFLAELDEFLRIPSISTLPENVGDVVRAAEWTAAKLKGAGLENIEIIQTDKHPLVYADWLHAPGKPTVLLYGHYDVQPPDPLELWKTPPFEPTIRDGNIYARGSADDKGQFFAHVKALESLFQVHGKPPVNIKVLIEGEEEIGGASISKFVPLHKDKLKADVALVSDTALYAEGIPTLCIGLRGLLYTEVAADGPSRDLHSGLYGGAAPNPIFGLAQLIAKAKGADGRINIPGWYNEVEDPAAAELESWKSLPFSERDFLEKEVGAKSLSGEKARMVLERVWSRPTMEVHGIAGGFTGAGAKTVIPATATAKVSFRLVPNQQPDKCLEMWRNFVAANTPEGLTFTVKKLSGAPATVVNADHPALQMAAKAFSDQMGKPTVFTRSGGSIPIVGEFQQHLGIPTILMGFGLPDDGLHSPNEKFKVDNYYLGIRSVADFLEKYGA